MEKNTRKIRVLRIIGECKTGGTETIALNYYHYLNHDLISMDFLFYGNSLPRFKEELSINGDSVINVPEYSKNLWKSIKKIRETVQFGNYDIIHSQLNSLNFFPLLGAWLGGGKIRIAANHSTANIKYEFSKSLIKFFLRPTAGLLATNYAACSDYAGKWCFGKYAFKNNKIKIIRNAIDLEKYYYSRELRLEVRKNYGWQDHFVIGHIGRFTEQKNQRFVVQIFSEIHKICPKALLIFIGDGHLISEIKAQVHKMNLDAYVQFLGIRFDINKLMQGMDIFLFPSLYEGLGNVIVEAQSVSLKSIVSDTIPREVCITEFVDFLPLKKNAKIWAKHILKYKNGYQRRTTYEDLKSHGYDIKYAAKDLEKYYFNLIRNLEN